MLPFLRLTASQLLKGKLMFLLYSRNVYIDILSVQNPSTPPPPPPPPLFIHVDVLVQVCCCAQMHAFLDALLINMSFSLVSFQFRACLEFRKPREKVRGNLFEFRWGIIDQEVSKGSLSFASE